MTDKVTITREEYEYLLDKVHKFDCLDQMGVDNWCGWDEAMEIYHKNKDENK